MCIEPYSRLRTVERRLNRNRGGPAEAFGRNGDGLKNSIEIFSRSNVCVNFEVFGIVFRMIMSGLDWLHRLEQGGAGESWRLSCFYASHCRQFKAHRIAGPSPVKEMVPLNIAEQ